MALDQNSILQLLMQLQGGGGGGSTPPLPVSGIGEGTPLSGLPLGEQGFGLGGGNSLLGGSPSVGGGGGGAGLDMFQLLAQLQGGDQGISPSQSLLQGIGGGPSAGGVGAGGQLRPQQGGVPQGTIGQAGLGGVQTAAALLGLLREGIGLTKTLSSFGQVTPTGGGQTIPDILRGTGELPSVPFALGADVFSGRSGGGFANLSPEELAQAIQSAQTGESVGSFTPLTPDINPTLGGGLAGGVGGLGTAGPAASISAPFLAGGGPESVGQVATQAPGSAAAGTGANLLGNLGAGIGGALGLTQAIDRPDVLGKATGAAEAAIAAAAIASGHPELALLAVIPGVADLLGGLFGGGGPSQRDINQAQAAQVGQAGAQQFAAQASQPTQSLQGLLAALGGAGFGDQFGQTRSPIAASLQIPVDQASRFGLPAGAQPIPGRGLFDFEFTPSRATSPLTPAIDPGIFGNFLNVARQDPSVLSFIQGSGDVSYLPLGQAQALAAQNQAAAQQAIQAFLGIPPPAPTPPPRTNPPPLSLPLSPTGPVFQGSADEFFTDSGVSRFAGGGS